MKTFSYFGLWMYILIILSILSIESNSHKVGGTAHSSFNILKKNEVKQKTSKYVPDILTNKMRGGVKMEASAETLTANSTEIILPKQPAMENTLQPPKISRKRVLLAVSYLAGMGLCGIVLAALGSSLQELASNCGVSSLEVGSVFVARGVGAVAGTLSSAKLYHAFNGKIIMGFSLFFFAVALALAPSVSSVRTLHVLFGAFGVCTALLDTGCQIQTRKLHGREAGPWLGANTVAFGISGCMVPFIAYLTKTLSLQYTVLSLLSTLTFLMVVVAPTPSPEEIPPPAIRPGQVKGKKQDYTTELTIAAMVFCLVGGKVTSTAYFTNYVTDTDIIEHKQIHFLLMVLWAGITAGRFAGIQNQRFFDLPTLYKHFNAFLVTGAVSMVSLSVFSKQAIVLWISILLYGFFNGPTVGFSYDLNNRLTSPSELGTSIVMLGLNTGASLMPYLTAAAWKKVGYTCLPIILSVSHLIPVFLLRITKYLANKNEFISFEKKDK